MRIVARRTRRAPDLEALRPREGLADEGGGAKPAIPVKHMSRKARQQVRRIGRGTTARARR